MSRVAFLVLSLVGCSFSYPGPPSMDSSYTVAAKMLPEASGLCPLLSAMSSEERIQELLGKSKREILQDYPGTIDLGGPVLSLVLTVDGHRSGVVFRGTRSDLLRVHQVGILCDPATNVEDVFSFLYSVYGKPTRSVPHRTATWVLPSDTVLVLDSLNGEEGVSTIPRVTLWDNLVSFDYVYGDSAWQGTGSLE